MTKKAEVDAAIEEWGDVDRGMLPDWLRSPSANGPSREFDIAMAVFFHQQHPEVTPIYQDGKLIGWKGVSLITLPGGVS